MDKVTFQSHASVPGGRAMNGRWEYTGSVLRLVGVA